MCRLMHGWQAWRTVRFTIAGAPSASPEFLRPNNDSCVSHCRKIGHFTDSVLPPGRASHRLGCAGRWHCEACCNRQHQRPSHLPLFEACAPRHEKPVRESLTIRGRWRSRLLHPAPSAVDCIGRDDAYPRAQIRGVGACLPYTLAKDMCEIGGGIRLGASPSFDRGRMNLQRIQFTGNGRLEQNSNGNGLTAVLYDQGYKYTVLRWFCYC
jgi:hypothetical protein